MTILEWILVLLAMAAVIGLPLLWAAYTDRTRAEEITDDLHEAAEEHELEHEQEKHEHQLHEHHRRHPNEL